MPARHAPGSRRSGRAAVSALLVATLAMIPTSAVGAEPSPSPAGHPAFIVTPPMVRITRPSSYAWVSAGETAGSAGWGATAVAFQGRTVAKVELLVNGILVSSDTTAPYGGQFSTVGLPQQLLLQARVTDSAGGRATTPEFAGRHAVVGSPVLDAGNLAWLPPVRISSTIRLLARPLQVPGVDVVRVEYRVGGSLVGTATAPPWDVAWTAPAVSTNGLVIDARMFDKMGADASAAHAIIDIIDDGGSLDINAPTDLAAIAGAVDVHVTASPSIAVDDMLHLYVDGLSAGQVTGASTVSWDSRSVDDGAHLLQAVVERAGGGADVVSTGTGVTVTNTDEPSLTFSISPSGPVVRGPLQITAVPANVAGDPVVGIRFEVNSRGSGSSYPSLPVNLTSTCCNAGSPDGSYRFRVLAELESGRILRTPDQIVMVVNMRGWMKRPPVGAIVSGNTTLEGVLRCDSECFQWTRTWELDGAVLGVSDPTQGQDFLWDTTQASNGVHSVTVVYRLTDGRIIRLPPRTVTVNN